MKKRVIIAIVLGVIIIGVFFFFKFVGTGKVVSSGNNQEVKVVPLSQEEREKVAQTLLSSKFIKDIPKEYPVALSFFSFEENQRVWRDSFLIGQNTLLSEGNPAIYLSLHSKYISEFNGNNLCDIVKTANKNKDLGFYSDYNKLNLFIKYAGMLKHRECFGF